MLFFSKEATAAAILYKLAGPIIAGCLADPNSWLSKKLGQTGITHLKAVMQFFDGKTQSVDVESEVKKLI